MDRLSHQQYLHAMGITTWQLRETPGQGAVAGVDSTPSDAMPANPQAAQANPVSDVVASATEPVTTMLPDVQKADWATLEAQVKACTACGLCEARTQAVFGIGVLDADLMVIGEGPGAEEDEMGLPFVGPAGQLLDAMLKAIDYARAPNEGQQGVYIANIVKCRPPRNRDPRPEESAACRAYLERQIALVQPKLILAVGGVAAKNLLETEDAVGRMRGKLHHYGHQQTPLMVTYHPAYLLRSPGEKRKAWEDLKQVRRFLEAAV